MEKRAILAIALSVLILFGFRYYEERRMAKISPPARNVPATQAITPPTAANLASAPPPAELSSPVIPSPGDTSAAAARVVVDGPIYRAVLDNQGALVSSWQLKDYKGTRGEIFEMIASAHDAETRPLLGSLLLEDPALGKLANNEYYQVEAVDSPDSAGTLTPPVTLVMRLRRGNLAIEKRYRFEKDNFLVDFTISCQYAGKPLSGRILLGQDIGPEKEHFLNRSTQIQAVSYRDGKVRRDTPPKDESEIKKYEGDVRWVGLDMQYFSIIAIPLRPPVTFDVQKRSVKTVGLDGKEVSRDLMRLALAENGSGEYRIYLGPKRQANLTAVKDADLSGVIDYGMFSILVLPLLSALKWINTYVNNFGLAIVALTFLLTLLLFPFRLKQMLSMKKMAVVQPKIKEIQEKYKRYKKTDPRRAEMNQEVMALYKEHNVNPLGGCLPMLLQMPLLFAFYALLAYSIELRQAPFMGWIHDLSVKDPYYVLPIVMGITTLISQKMTPMAPGSDPTQAKMMMLMPVVFTIMFLNMSSGLNLYFLCSNVFQIGFQAIAQRWVGDGRADK